MKNRIIAVDDERGAGVLLKLVLPEYEIQIEPDCSAALLAALDRPPELFLLDIQVPGLTGTEFAERLQQSERLRHIPVIFVSASVSTGRDGEPAMIAGHPAFGKPFELVALKRHIAAELAKRAQPQPQPQPQPIAHAQSYPQPQSRLLETTQAAG